MWASGIYSPPRLHTSFTTRPHRNNRMWSLSRQPAPRQQDQGVHVNPRIPLAALAACVLATGVAACGSSNDDNNNSGSATAAGAPSVSATLNGAGSTFAAPIYQQIGADLKDKGLTINYQGVGSG